MKVLLASNSPRRRILLKKIFDNFDSTSPSADEDFIGETPEETVKTIALRKLEVVKHLNYDIIISADTIVYCKDKYITKPIDENDAYNMLKFLANNEHIVYTGVAIKYYNTIECLCETSSVYFKDLSDEEIINYIRTHEVYDKAGAYAIQDNVTVNNYKGSYDNIVGLPTEKLQIWLKEKASYEQM